MVNRAATDGEAAHVLARASDQLHRAALTKRQFFTRFRCDRVSGEWRRKEKDRKCPHHVVESRKKEGARREIRKNRRRKLRSFGSVLVRHPLQAPVAVSVAHTRYGTHSRT